MLLLDEPLAALDARTRLEVQAELKRHLAEFAGPSLLVTHDPLEALVLADRLVVLEEGRVVQRGTPAEVARRPATAYVAALVGLNLYAGQAAGDRVELDRGGRFVVPDHGQAGDVLVALRPSAVVVSRHRPDEASVRNVWPVQVRGLSLLADRVRLAVVGRPSALVDVTPPRWPSSGSLSVRRSGCRRRRSIWRSTRASPHPRSSHMREIPRAGEA